MITDDDPTPPMGTELPDDLSELCSTWDAKRGLRCIVDGCNHEAAPGLVCPCHEQTE